MSIAKLREYGCKVEKVDEDSDVYLVSKDGASLYATERDICDVNAWILMAIEDEEIVDEGLDFQDWMDDGLDFQDFAAELRAKCQGSVEEDKE